MNAERIAKDCNVVIFDIAKISVTVYESGMYPYEIIAELEKVQKKILKMKKQLLEENN